MNLFRISLLVSLLFGLTYSQGSTKAVDYYSRLLVGFQETEAIYPGGGTVAFGPAKSIAEGLGLGYSTAGGRAFLTLGSRVAEFGISNTGSDASRFLNAYGAEGVIWVPIRELAKNLDLYYRNDFGASVLALNPAKLVKVDRAQIGGLERYIISFDRDVQVGEITGDTTLLPLIGVQDFPEVPDRSTISFNKQDWGLEMTLPAGAGKSRIYYLPKKVIFERGEIPTVHRIVIDAGHGGGDTGIVIGSLREKDLTVSVANKLASILMNLGKGQLEVIRTRTNDKSVSLAARAQYATTAEVFISVHGAPGDKVVSFSHPENQNNQFIEKGRETLISAPANKKELLSRYIAASGSSTKLAQAITEKFVGSNLTAKTAQESLFVLSQTAASGALVEIGFEQLKTPQLRNTAADNIADAVLEYLKIDISPAVAPPPLVPTKTGGTR